VHINNTPLSISIEKTEGANPARLPQTEFFWLLWEIPAARAFFATTEHHPMDWTQQLMISFYWFLQLSWHLYHGILLCSSQNTFFHLQVDEIQKEMTSLCQGIERLLQIQWFATGQRKKKKNRRIKLKITWSRLRYSTETKYVLISRFCLLLLIAALGWWCYMEQVRTRYLICCLYLRSKQCHLTSEY